MPRKDSWSARVEPVLALVAVLMTTVAALAAFPGQNGKSVTVSKQK